MDSVVSENLLNDLVPFSKDRTAVYAFMSRCYEREIDEKFVEILINRSYFKSDITELSEAFYSLKRQAKKYENRLEHLAITYNRIFYGMGPRTCHKAFPYESVYTSHNGLMKQASYSQALSAYRDASLKKTAEFTEPEDHIALELAFMAKLGERTISALQDRDVCVAEKVLREQSSFLNTHLIDWFGPFAHDVKQADNGSFYKAVVTFTEIFLKCDAAALDEIIEEDEMRDVSI